MKRSGRASALVRVLRRALALFLATLAVWLLMLTANLGAAATAFRSLGESPGFVTAALRAELEGLALEETGSDGLAVWQRLVVGESLLLSDGGAAVAAYRALGGQTADPEPTASAAPGEPDDPEDTHELTSLPQTGGAAVERTLTAGTQENYASAAGVYIFNRTAKELDVAAMAAAKVNISLSGDDDGPQVLIMHTHGTEAYTPDGDDVYVESDASRTIDENYNMIRVGEEIKRVFTELGLRVVHDKTLYDYPAYSGSYDRSKAAVEAYLAQYPSIKIVLDVHRDALIGTDGTVYKAVTTVDGVKTAQVLLVVGSDDGGLAHPQWQENLTLAVKIQQSMNSLWPTLARPVTLRTSRFNQQLTTGSLLVEIGCHGNTLQEALAGARLFARSAGQVLLGLT